MYRMRTDSDAVSVGRRLAAFAVDFALATALVFALRNDRFSGLAAALLVTGVYKVAMDATFGRTVGQVCLGHRVVLSNPDCNPLVSWTVRESRLWLLPGVLIAVQMRMPEVLSPEGLVLFLQMAVGLVLLELGVLIADIAPACRGSGAPTLFDTLSSTRVRRDAAPIE
jgi:hypothetical protein